MDERKQRFLVAYRACLSVAEAARAARIHRTTVYCWRRDGAFVEAMRAAWQAGYAEWYQAVYLPQDAARRAAHEQRKAELRPLRQALAAAIRARKRR